MTLFFRLTNFPRATARGVKCYPSTFRRRGAFQTSDRVARQSDFRTRIVGTRGNGVQPDTKIQWRIGLRKFLFCDAVYKLHHTELFGLVKFKSQHLHQNLFGQAECSCQSCECHIPEPEFRKYNFVSYGDLSFPCSGTFFMG